jgi:hypothetical protein
MQQTKPPSKGLVGLAVAGVGALAIAIGHGAPHLFGEVFGHMVGEYLGLNLIVPAIFIAACWWAASRLVKPRPVELVPVVGVTGGQLAFYLVVALFLGGPGILLLAPDMVALAVGLAWLLKSGARAPLIFLLAYEGVGLAANILTFINGELNPGVFSAMLIRLLTLALLWNAFAAVKSPQPELTSPSQTHA